MSGNEYQKLPVDQISQALSKALVDLDAAVSIDELKPILHILLTAQLASLPCPEDFTAELIDKD